MKNYAHRRFALTPTALALVLSFNHYAGAAGSFATNGPLQTPRYFHTTTLLPNGKVLVAGGDNNAGGQLSSAELQGPARGTWTGTGSTNTARV